jgi:hypothetical protein
VLTVSSGALVLVMQSAAAGKRNYALIPFIHLHQAKAGWPRRLTIHQREPIMARLMNPEITAFR